MEPDTRVCPHCGHEFDANTVEVATVGGIVLDPTVKPVPHAYCPNCKRCIACTYPDDPHPDQTGKTQ